MIRGVGAKRAEGYTDFIEKLLVVFSAMFLFAGIYKEVIPFVVDWTLFSLVVALVSALYLSWQQKAPLAPLMSLLPFFALLAYLGIRSLPLDPSGFGARKLLEAGGLGVPAFIMGYHIARVPARLALFATVTLVLSLVLAVAVSAVAIASGNITSTNSLFGAGYQLTGSFIAGSLLVALPLLTGDHWRSVMFGMVLAIVGLAFVGSVPSLSFLYLSLATIVVGALIFVPGKAFALRTISVAGLGILAILVISVIAQPPAAVYRAIWKAQVALMQADVDVPVVTEWLERKHEAAKATGENVRSILGGKVLLHPEEEIDNYVDRVDLMTEAARGFLEFPLIGNGFGSFLYHGVRTEHNIVLELGYEGGILAILAFVGFVGICLVPAVNVLTRGSDSSRACLVLSIFGVFVFSLAGQMVGGYFIGRILMFSLGLLVGVSYYSRFKEVA